LFFAVHLNRVSAKQARVCVRFLYTSFGAQAMPFDRAGLLASRKLMKAARELIKILLEKAGEEAER